MRGSDKFIGRGGVEESARPPEDPNVDAVDDIWDLFARFEGHDAFTGAWLSASSRVHGWRAPTSGHAQG